MLRMRSGTFGGPKLAAHLPKVIFAPVAAVQEGSVVRPDEKIIDWTHGAQKDGQRSNRG